jgi:hypothetical protein
MRFRLSQVEFGSNSSLLLLLLFFDVQYFLTLSAAIAQLYGYFCSLFVNSFYQLNQATDANIYLIGCEFLTDVFMYSSICEHITSECSLMKADFEFESEQNILLA